MAWIAVVTLYSDTDLTRNINICKTDSCIFLPAANPVLCNLHGSQRLNGFEAVILTGCELFIGLSAKAKCRKDTGRKPRWAALSFHLGITSYILSIFLPPQYPLIPETTMTPAFVMLFFSCRFISTVFLHDPRLFRVANDPNLTPGQDRW